jgi:predicted nucleic-acid-binding Zn-ribbon protein
MQKKLEGIGDKAGQFSEISGSFSHIKHIEYVDQNPIGRSSRSNPVTYIKAYDDIRDLYAKEKLSKVRGYQAKHFSFNVDGGRCETCKGEGSINVEMVFMADVSLPCETCGGKRFKKEVLEVAFEGKNIDNIFDRQQNYYLSYVNINRATFRMLDETIDDRYKVSNTPNLTGWNSSMSIREIIVHLTTNYGVPDAMVMHNNDLLFRSPFPATEAPEMLFHRLEQCQEVQTIGQDPSLATHIMNVAVRILMQSGMFQPKEFETWAAMPNKTYPLLKTFVHEAYTRRLTEINLRNTAGALGYVANQNMFNVLCDKNDPDNGTTDDDTTVTQTAATASAGISTLGQTYAPTVAATIPADVATAIQQLSANQNAIMQQMAAIAFSPPPTQRNTYHVPPVQTVQIPSARGGGFQQGRGGGW